MSGTEIVDEDLVDIVVSRIPRTSCGQMTIMLHEFVQAISLFLLSISAIRPMYGICRR